MSRYTDRASDAVEYVVTAAPSYEILTTAELRQHLRLPDFPDAADAAEDAYLTSLIKAAGNAIETQVRRPVRAQERELVLDAFPHRGGYGGGAYGAYSAFWWGGYGDDNAIILDITPIRAVNAIRYRRDGVEVTMPTEDYRVQGANEGINRRVEIYPAHGESWPYDTDYHDGEVTIAVDCGWTQANLPEEFKHAARIICAGWYNMRQEVVMASTSPAPRSAKYLLQQFERFF